MYRLKLKLTIKLIKLSITLSALMLLCASPAQAVRVAGLYEAAVPVSDQQAATRVVALKDALRRVIIKVTGQNSVPASMLGQSSAIEHMVEQFGYEHRRPSADAEPQLQLWAKFNPTGTRQLIRQARLPIWPEERPATLVWLAIDDTAGRQIVAENSIHIVKSQLYQAANQRGLPLVLPLMDLQESGEISFEVISNLRQQPLQQASAKYASQQVLIGYIQKTEDDLWRARWSLLDNGVGATTTPVGSLADVIASGINPLASRIARQFSSVSNVDGEQYIDLAIDDIRGAADYAQSLNYLQSLSLVSKVEVLGTENQQLNFRLHTQADLASILRVVELGRVLYARDTVDQLIFGLNP